MTESFADLKTRILRQRPICEICGVRAATELHHCLVHDSKRYHRLVTVEENLMPVCSICHTSGQSTANSYEIKVKFAKSQIERGYNIRGWYKGLPLKSKENWLLEIEKEHK